MFYNTINYYNTVEWLIPADSSLTVAAGNSANVDITFDATELIGGEYDAYIVVNSNDPVNPEVKVPAHLSVTGIPIITTSEDTLNFGQVFTGYTDSLELVINNTGTDDLIIDTIYTDDIHFTINTDSLFISPEESSILRVFYHAGTIQHDTAQLVLKSNDLTNDTVYVLLTAESVLPPVIDTTPDSFEFTMYVGDSLTDILTINNLGGSNLYYEISSSADSVLNVTTVGAEKNMYPNLNIYDENGDTYENVLQRKNNVITPIEVNSVPAITSMGMLEDFESTDAWPWSPWNQVEYGGSVTGACAFEGLQGIQDPDWHYRDDVALDGAGVSLSAWFKPSYASSGRFYFGFGANAAGCFSLVAAPNTTELILQHNQSYDYEDLYSITQTWIADNWYKMEISFEGDNNFMFTLYDSDGTTVLNSFMYNITDYTTGGVAIRSFSQVCIDNIELSSGASYITTNPVTGTVIASGSEDVEIKVNASGLAPADYYATINISSNDPITPEIGVPVHVNVIGTPRISISEDTVNFGQVFISYTDSVLLTIANVGSETLIVDTIYTNDTKFTLSGDEFTLDPGEEEYLTAYYTATATANDTADLIFESNDLSTPVVSIPLIAEALVPPVMTVTPDSIDALLAAGDSTIEYITIDNTTGGSDLEFEVGINQISHTSLSNMSKREESRSQNLNIYSKKPTVVKSLKAEGSNKDMMAGASRLFVVDYNLAEVHEISPVDGTIINTIYTPDTVWGPEGLAYDGTYLYLITHGGYLRQLDPNTGVEYDNMYIGTGYDGLGTDGEYIFATYYGNGVDVFDFEAKTYLGTILDGYVLSGGLSFGGNRETVFVTENFNLLYEYDLYTDTIVNSYSFEYLIYGIGYSESLNILFVADADSSYIRAYNPDTFEELYKFDGFASALASDEFIGAGGDKDWITTEITSGIVLMGTSVDIPVKLNAKDLYGGIYNASVDISSNDPANSLVQVPVTLTVTGIPEISVADTFDFGMVWIGDTAKEMIMVSNIGTDMLSVTSATTTDNQFIVDEAIMPMNVEPGTNHGIPVDFIPTVAGEFTTALTINSNDPDSPDTVIVLKGQAESAPELSVTPLEIIDTVFVGLSAEHELTLSNTGGGYIEYILSTDPTNIGLSSDSDTLASGDTSIVTVSILTSTMVPGNYSDSIIIYSNDPTEPFKVVSIFYIVESYSPPVVVDSIDDASLYITEINGININLTNHIDVLAGFSSLNFGLVYNNSIIEADVSGNILSVIPKGVGSTEVLLEATDNISYISDTFNVVVLDNNAPVVTAPIADISVLTTGSIEDIDLSGVFTDADSDALEYLVDTGNMGAVVVGISGSVLSIEPVNEGEATIIVLATDNKGPAVPDTFIVSVEEDLQPQIISKITDVTLNRDLSETLVIDLDTVFSEPNSQTLYFVSELTDDAIVSVAFSGNVVTYSPLKLGSTDVEIIATDSSTAPVSINFTITVEGDTEVDPQTEISNVEVYPNPLTDIGHISFELTSGADVRFIIYSVDGKKLSTSIDEYLQSGKHTLDFDTRGLDASMYIYHLIVNNKLYTKGTLVKE
jgi:hypothetical protein